MKCTIENFNRVCDLVKKTFLESQAKWQNCDKLHTECWTEIDLLTAYKQAIELLEIEPKQM